MNAISNATRKVFGSAKGFRTDGLGGLVLVEEDVLEPGPGEVMIRTWFIGHCGSDDDWRRNPAARGLRLGHEGVGLIVAVGEGVDPAMIGMRVAVDPHQTCGVCRECLAVPSRRNCCRKVNYQAVNGQLDGCHVQLYNWPAKGVVAVPFGLSMRLASMTEMLSVVTNATRTAARYTDPSDDDVILIVGTGPVAWMTAMMCKLQDHRRPVLMAGRSEAVGEAAQAVRLERSGAQMVDEFILLSGNSDPDGARNENKTIFESLWEGHSIAVAYESTGINSVLEALHAGWPCRGTGGSVSYGCYVGDTKMPTRPRRCVQGWDTLIRRSFLGDFSATLELLASHSADFEKLLGHVVSFDHLAYVFRDGIVDLSGAIKVGGGTKIVIEDKAARL
jgi:threonine dehydrogenase-like Zn-dependent dehydrogenase